LTTIIGQWWVDPQVSDGARHGLAKGIQLEQGVVVRDDVVLTALVERADAGRHGFLITKIRAATVEHADGQVYQVWKGDGNRVGGAVILGVMPFEQHIPSLAGSDVDIEFLE
jgi:hypothetical protein